MQKSGNAGQAPPTLHFSNLSTPACKRYCRERSSVESRLNIAEARLHSIPWTLRKFGQRDIPEVDRYFKRVIGSLATSDLHW